MEILLSNKRSYSPEGDGRSEGDEVETKKLKDEYKVLDTDTPDLEGSDETQVNELACVLEFAGDTVEEDEQDMEQVEGGDSGAPASSSLLDDQIQTVLSFVGVPCKSTSS